MLRTILVGLDGSAYSQRAIELGIEWAKRFDAMLVGLGVIDEPGIRRPQAAPIGGASYKEGLDEFHLADARRQVEQFLEQFALRCAEAKVACKVLEEVGDPIESLLTAAQRFDLILLGKETRFQFETRDAPDDCLKLIIKSAPRPVITVGDSSRFGGPVVIAFDGSVQASRTLQSFVSLGLSQLGEIHLLSVHDDHQQAMRIAERAMEYLESHGVKPHRRVVAASSPATAIVEEVRRLNGSLLVMGAYGRSSLREFFFGSVTRTLLRERSLPLFLYH